MEKGAYTSRWFRVIIFLVLLAAPAAGGWGSDKQHAAAYQQLDSIAAADTKLQRLIEGNQRFSSGRLVQKEDVVGRRMELIKGQSPSAVVLSCSDSRVPPELVFDQGLGDIFVIRVAGNVAAPVELGSIEYAVEHLNVPLIIVLGHDKCGAVTAAIKGGKHEGNIRSIIRKIAPSVRKAKATGKKGEELLDAAIEENAKNVAAVLVKESKVIKHLVEQKRLKIVAAKYEFESGKVELLK